MTVAPAIPNAQISERVESLWADIDHAREGTAFVQQTVYVATPSTDSTTPHSHLQDSTHAQLDHSADYLTQVTRLDRDLLDVNTLIHVFLTGIAETDPSLEALMRKSASRVRKGLRVLAFYAKVS